MSRRDDLVLRLMAERERNANLPGAEYDVRNGPNDWMAIAASYCLRSVARKGLRPQRDEFEDDLIKAMAVMLAALEHADHLSNQGLLRPAEPV